MANHFKASLESLGKVSVVYERLFRDSLFLISVSSRKQRPVASIYFIGQSFVAEASVLCPHNPEKG